MLKRTLLSLSAATVMALTVMGAARADGTHEDDRDRGRTPTVTHEHEGVRSNRDGDVGESREHVSRWAALLLQQALWSRMIRNHEYDHEHERQRWDRNDHDHDHRHSQYDEGSHGRDHEHEHR